MSFVSQVSKSRAPSSRIGESSIVASQSYKTSTNAQELSIRITSGLLQKAAMKVGDFVDVLYDKESDSWMLAKMSGGLKITGKDDAPTGLIRYTLKEGHARFTEDKALLPVRRSSVEEEIKVSDGEIIFKLTKDGDSDDKESAVVR